MVDLPTPVKKQLAQIEELYKQPAATPAEGAEGGQLPADETPAPDAAQHVVEPAQDAPAPAAEAPTEAPAPAPAQDPNPWEQRYKTLQGLHNRNVEDLKGRVKARDAEIAEMRKQLAELQAARPAPAVDPRDAETFGEDLVAMVQRVVEARLGHSGAQTDSRMADLESRLEGTTNVVAQTAESLFLQHLGRQVADYEAINVDQGFLDWLAQPDEVYGEPRQNALDRAVNALNADHAARIFKAYKATLAPAQPPAETPAQPSPKAQLAKQVAPRTASSAAPQAPQAKRVYSAAEVTKFYDDVAKGRYASRPDDARREEAAINAALAEGRIR